MMREIEILAPAKVNLCLSVDGLDGKGYHNLDSVVAQIPIYDRIVINERKDDQVIIGYLDGEIFQDDVALKMASIVRKKYNLPGVDILVEKHIPVGAGLGGSSADAAGIARGLSELFQIGQLEPDLLIKVGSDIPCMYFGGTLRMKGRGQKLEKIALPSDLYVSLIINRNALVHTGDVFFKYDEIGGENGSVDTFLSYIIPFNSLEKAATMICPEIKNIREMLEICGFGRVVMTGSGSGVIGFTPDMKAFANISSNVENEAKKRGLLHYRFKISAKSAAKDWI